VKNTTPLICAFFLLLMVGTGLGRPSIALAAPAGKTTSIQDAIQMGLIEATIESADGMGFRQPLVLLHIINHNNSSLALNIPLGTQLFASQPGFATLVTAESINFNSDPQATLEIDLNAFSLSDDLRFPDNSGLNDNRYSVGEVIQEKILDLLKEIDGHSQVPQYGSQLALWSLSMAKSLEQVASERSTSPEDQVKAQQILAFTSKSISPVLILMVLLGIAVIVAAGLTLKDLRRSSPPHPSPLPTPPGASSPPPIVGSDIPSRSAPSIIKNAEIISPVKLEQPPVGQVDLVHLLGVSGACTDRQVDLKVPSMIGRGTFEWVILEHDSVSAPHAILDLSEQPCRVKDLKSKTGVDLELTHLGDRFTDFEPGQKLTIGAYTLVVNNGSIEIVDGPTKAIKNGNSGGLVVISNRKYDLHVFGEDDKRVSDAHAILYAQNGEVFIKDLNSSNGIIINTRRINFETALKSGDRLAIGASEYLVQLQ
jgi:hypothetical protein